MKKKINIEFTIEGIDDKSLMDNIINSEFCDAIFDMIYLKKKSGDMNGSFAEHKAVIMECSPSASLRWQGKYSIETSN